MSGLRAAGEEASLAVDPCAGFLGEAAHCPCSAWSTAGERPLLALAGLGGGVFCRGDFTDLKDKQGRDVCPITMTCIP